MENRQIDHKQIVKKVALIAVIIVGILLALHVLNTYVAPGIMDALVKLHGG